VNFADDLLVYTFAMQRMLQHRQTIGSGPVGFVYKESVIISGCDKLDEPADPQDTSSLNEIDAVSGNTIRDVSSCNLARRNLRIVATRNFIVKYDYAFGQFIFSDRATDAIFGKFRKTPPAGSLIACTCASELSDGMFFYAYAPVTATDDSAGLSSNFHAVHAVLIGEDKVTLPMQLSTTYKGSGFADKPTGQIVSLQCHPTQQLLFVVYSHGQVQVQPSCISLSFGLNLFTALLQGVVLRQVPKPPTAAAV
jgi:hypothetical protein